MGKVWKFGDNIDTDVIIAARYLNTSDGKELAKKIFEDTRAGFASMVCEGDIIVAGDNFGCGSSREHAPIAIKEAGIRAVIAPYFARIFYRNSFNTGLLILEVSREDVDAISEGDELEISFENQEIINKTRGQVYSFRKIPPFMKDLLDSGGLIQYASKRIRDGLC